MTWVQLLTAAMREIGWAIGLKYRVHPPKTIDLGRDRNPGEFLLLARAARETPIGTACSVFVGIGAGGTGLIFLFDEPAGVMRIASLLATVLGVVGRRRPLPRDRRLDRYEDAYMSVRLHPAKRSAWHRPLPT